MHHREGRYQDRRDPSDLRRHDPNQQLRGEGGRSNGSHDHHNREPGRRGVGTVSHQYEVSTTRPMSHFPQVRQTEGQPSDRQEAIPRGSSKVRLSVCHRNSIFNRESSRTRPGYVLQWIAMHFPLDLSFYLFIYLFISSSRISTDTAHQIGARAAGVE